MGLVPKGLILAGIVLVVTILVLFKAKSTKIPEGFQVQPTVTNFVTGLSQPRGMVFNSDFSILYVAQHGSQRISAINVATKAVTNLTLSQSIPVQELGIDSANHLYVAPRTLKSVFKIVPNLSGGTSQVTQIISTTAGTNGVFSVTVDRTTTDVFYYSTYEGPVVRVRRGTGGAYESTTLTAPIRESYLAYDSTTKRLYITNHFDHLLMYIPNADTRTGVSTPIVAVNSGLSMPVGTTVSRDGRYMFLGNWAGKKLTRTTVNNSVTPPTFSTTEITTADNPWTVLEAPNNEFYYSENNVGNIKKMTTQPCVESPPTQTCPTNPCGVGATITQTRQIIQQPGVFGAPCQGSTTITCPSSPVFGPGANSSCFANGVAPNVRCTWTQRTGSIPDGTIIGIPYTTLAAAQEAAEAQIPILPQVDIILTADRSSYRLSRGGTFTASATGTTVWTHNANCATRELGTASVSPCTSCGPSTRTTSYPNCTGGQRGNPPCPAPATSQTTCPVTGNCLSVGSTAANTCGYDQTTATPTKATGSPTYWNLASAQQGCDDDQQCVGVYLETETTGFFKASAITGTTGNANVWRKRAGCYTCNPVFPNAYGACSTGSTTNACGPGTQTRTATSSPSGPRGPANCPLPTQSQPCTIPVVGIGSVVSCSTAAATTTTGNVRCTYTLQSGQTTEAGITIGASGGKTIYYSLQAAQTACDTDATCRSINTSDDRMFWFTSQNTTLQSRAASTSYVKNAGCHTTTVGPAVTPACAATTGQCGPGTQTTRYDSCVQGARSSTACPATVTTPCTVPVAGACTTGVTATATNGGFTTCGYTTSPATEATTDTRLGWTLADAQWACDADQTCAGVYLRSATEGYFKVTAATQLSATGTLPGSRRNAGCYTCQPTGPTPGSCTSPSPFLSCGPGTRTTTYTGVQRGNRATCPAPAFYAFSQACTNDVRNPPCNTQGSPPNRQCTWTSTTSPLTDITGSQVYRNLASAQLAAERDFTASFIQQREYGYTLAQQGTGAAGTTQTGWATQANCFTTTPGDVFRTPCSHANGICGPGTNTLSYPNCFKGPRSAVNCPAPAPGVVCSTPACPNITGAAFEDTRFKNPYGAANSYREQCQAT